ncbi:MAG: hypothetical protein DCC55_33140 [Chloroflexi bacterium]|nr:MAG: hypothetical protein DCC55_33140 [Chloroflexota bacterium]
MKKKTLSNLSHRFLIPLVVIGLGLGFIHAEARSALPSESQADAQNAEIPTKLIPAAPLRPHLMPVPDLDAGIAQATAVADFAYDPTSIYDQKGTNAPRGFSAQAPAELIDPFSGNLILRQVDLALPGAGGLDLVLQRVYNSKIHRNYAARATGDPNRVALGMLFVPPSPLGLGWNLHLGRIVGGVNDGPNELLPGPRYYEASDGSQHPFFTYAGPGCESGTNAACLVTKGFDNPYRLDPNGPWYMATANGLNITFDHTAFDGSTLVHYATEIRDVHGNRIRITYHDNTIPGISVQRDYFRHFIDTIIDSAGRTISFGYSVVNQPDVVRLTSITAAGRTHRYTYTNNTPWGPLYAFLAAAQPPAGAPWRYEYAGLNNGDCADNGKRWCELTRVTYPAGGTVTFTFSDLTFYAQTNPMAVRAVTRRVVGGRQISPATWTYQYNRAANYSGEEHTVITRPGNSQEIYTYFGVGNSAYNPLGLAWKAGVLLKKQVREGGAILQTETFDWVASPAISGEIWGDPWIGFDTGVFLPRLQQHTVQRGNLTWSTIHTSYNELNNSPRCTTEQGDGARRYRLNTYRGLSLQQGDYLFVFAGLPALAGLSYTPFSSAQCDPAQSSSWTPDLGDELTYQEYDAQGRLASREVNGVITDYRYHNDGNLQAEITYQGANRTNGYCTTFSDYQYGVPRTTFYGATAPACSGGVYSTQRTLNTDGSVQQETDGRGHSTEFLYDGLGRRTRITPPGQTPIVITYDGSASSFNTRRRVEQGEYWVESRFDGFGRTLEQESSAGIHLRQSYDAFNRITFRSLPGSSPGSDVGDTLSFDAVDRIRTVTHHDGTTVTYAYGTNVHTVAITDEAGHTTVHTRRAFSHPDDFWLVRVQLPGEPAPAADTYTYLVGGHLTGIDYAGRQRAIDYNFAKQVRRESSPEFGNIHYGYDAAGNLRCRHWTSLCSDTSYTHPNNDVRYTVDGLNRVTEISYASGGSVTLTYDNANNVERMVDSAGTHEFEYSDTNRLERRTSTIDGVTYVTRYSYDNRGNLTSITYPSGRTITYDRDNGNRISSVSGFASNVQYHPNGLISRMTYANGIVTTLGLDSRQRPDLLQAGAVVGLNYDFDAVDNLTRLADTITPNNTTNFNYDDLDRLTGANGPWGSLQYAYNAAGDRTSETLNGQTTTYAYDPDGLLTNLSGRINLTYGYDHKGNVSHRGEHSYQYDAVNRLVSVSGPDGGTTYVYDGLGQKSIARRQGCQNSRVYHYDQNGVRIAEYTLEGVLLKEYIALEQRTIAELDYTPGAVGASEIDFGDVERFTTITRTVTISNYANTPLALSNLNLNLPFGLGLDQPATVPANGALDLPVTFRPLERRAYTVRLEVCESSGLRIDLTLRGRGVAAEAKLNTTELDLGDVPYGETVSRSVTVSSTGEIPLRIAGWSAPAGLLVTPAGPSNVPPGGTHTVTITFDSMQSCGGLFEGTVNLVSNSAGNVALKVKANVLALQVDTQDVAFGPVQTGESRTQNVTLRNRAAVPLTPLLSFDGAPQFSVGTLPTNRLEPGDSIEIPVTYRPADKRWSPFGDHAMLRAGFAECSLVCDASAHLIGNVAAETVPGTEGLPGKTPTLALAGNTIHVASVPTETLQYAVRSAAGVWAQGPDPANGATRVRSPALLARPDNRLTMLWEEASSSFQIKLRQREGEGNWGDLCVQDGFRRGWGPLAPDEAGNVWMAWLDRASFALNVSPIFSAAGLCQAGQAPRIQQSGFSWDNLNLASGLAGQLGLAVTQSERLRFLGLDLTSNSASLETPLNTEINFNSTAAIAVDSQGGWHLVWPEIAIGHDYTAPARYLYRDPNQGWSQPVTLMAGSQDARSMRVAVDSLGGVHVAWSDRACAAPDGRKVYYATRPAFSNRWQVSDVSTPGYPSFDVDLALALDSDRLAAAWSGHEDEKSGALLFGQVEVGGSPVLSATVTPSQGGSLVALDGHIDVQFPPGAVSEATEIFYTRQLQPAQTTGGLQFAGRSFTLVARSASGPVTQFGAPFTLTLRYDDADWQATGLASEEDLNLYFWNGSAWQAILPCAGCTHDTGSNTVTVRLDHLTEFALLGRSSGQPLYLPLVAR